MIDPAIPSFCTFYKKYAGTINDMKIIYSSIKSKFFDKGLCHENLIKQSMEQYFNGDINAINQGIYGEEPIFIPTNTIDICKHSIENKEIIYMNIWDFEIKLRFSKCLTENIITQIENTGQYLTFVKFNFTNLETFDDYLNCWKIIKSPLWGNPGMLIIDNKNSENIVAYSPLYLEDKSFNTLNEAKNYISDINQINYSTVFNEIFGNG